MRNQLHSFRFATMLSATATTLLLFGHSLDLGARQNTSPTPPLLNFVGVTAHAWGTWVAPGLSVEDGVDEARTLCNQEDWGSSPLYCEVIVFEGAERAPHVYPVPESNRSALKWVFLYRHDETPRIIVEEAHEIPGEEKRRWTFDE